jgi:hypothetical protein
VRTMEGHEMPPFSIVVSAHHGNGLAYCRRYAISDFRTSAQVDPHACETCAFVGVLGQFPHRAGCAEFYKGLSRRNLLRGIALTGQNLILAILPLVARLSALQR